jgi:hypothetical protein
MIKTKVLATLSSFLLAVLVAFPSPQDPDGKSDPKHGIREFVAGTGGKNSHRIFTIPKPNSESRQADTFGVLKLTLHPKGYDGSLVRKTGKRLAIRVRVIVIE